MFRHNKDIRTKRLAAGAADFFHLPKRFRAGAGSAGSHVFSKKGYPLHLHISLVYILLIVLLLSIIGVFNYLEAKKNMLQSGQHVFMRINDEIKSNLRYLQDTAIEALFYLYQSPVVDSRELADKLKLTPLMGTILQFHPELSSIAVGRDNGNFFRFGRAGRSAAESADPALRDARYLIRTYESPKEYQEFIYLNHHFEIVARRDVPHDGYDPRTREWYRQAMTTDTAISTKPYFFRASECLGKSVSRMNAARDMVVSISFPLAGIDRIFDDVRMTDASELLVFDNEGNVLYYSGLDIAIKETPGGEHSLFTFPELDYPLRAAITDAIAAESFNTPIIAGAGGKEFLFAVSRLMDDSVGGTSYYVAISSPSSALLPDAADLIRRQGLFTLLALGIAVPASWLFSRRLSKDFVALSAVAQDARNFSFSIKEPASSSVAELNDLSGSIFHANNTLKRFLDITSAISQERDYGRLLDTVLYETMGTVDAAAGILYLLSEDGRHLIPIAARAHPADGDDPGTEGDASFSDSLPTIAVSGGGLAPHLAEALNGVPQTGRAGRDDWPSETMRAVFPEPYMHLISTPLVYSQKVTGVLCLYRRGGEEEPNRGMLSFIGRLSGGAAVAIENHRLIVEQKRLFDAFIKLIAASIDSKSPYTGGHCQRVPVIAKMLAAAVDKTDKGIFADSRIGEGNWEVLRVASWLHDCGKIITPEHVVDKATKLETIYNRIHEVRMRFEVLKRDAEIACCRAVLGGEEGEEDAQERLRARLRQLDDDFAFVAQCNIGDEAMTPEHLRRLEDVAALTWRRTISDRLGLSEAERKRKEAFSDEALPATEHVLADKPEHLIPRDENAPRSAGDRFAFTLLPPEHKYNLGELANLSISRGTLTKEERYEINNHVMQTMIILSHLPFPEEYGDIVGIAGSHHERVDAGGYPRGIGREAMSVEARIIAIADVFEALTAADRPYKQAKTLSESLAIMARMAKSGHLDPDLFTLFIRSGVYRRYAEQYLEKRQIDAVDEDGLLTVTG